MAKMSTKQALKAHMAKGAGAHPDANVKKLRAGGKTNMDMKTMGRGMAKVANQKSPVRSVRKMGI
jgi:hypothetical protein